MTHFNLIDEPWIPVYLDGKRDTVSLRTALTEAPAISALSLPTPTALSAVLRQVLLPVVLDALGAPRSDEEWLERWEEPPPASELSDYLDRHVDRFDLFHPRTPFAQVGGVESLSGETRSSSLLLPAIASGNNVPLFSSRTESDPPRLTPARAAIALIECHCWDTAAIKTGLRGDPRAKAGKTTGNPTGPLGQQGVIVPTGPTLWETLLLNLSIIPDGLEPNDRPQWRATPRTPEWEERAALGLMDLLTWQSRRIRLHPAEGEGGPMVDQVVIGAGDRLLSTPSFDPHPMWTIDPRPKAGAPPQRPRRLRSGRAVWLGVDALLAVEHVDEGVQSSGLMRQIAGLSVDDDALPDDYPLRVHAVGVVYGTQSAVVDDVVYDQMPLPVVALQRSAEVRAIVQQLATDAHQVSNALNSLAGDLRQASGGGPTPWDKGERPEVAFLHAADLAARRLLQGLADDPAQAQRLATQWHATAMQIAFDIAQPLLDSVPPTAFAGRLVKRGSKQVPVRVSTANRRFQGQLRQILYRAVQTEENEREEVPA